MAADIIQQFVDWMETMAGTQLAGVSAGIMAIAAIFAGIRLGKRLVYSMDDPDYAAGVDAHLQSETCPHCGRETLGDACYCDEGAGADDEDDKAGHYEEYHELLDSGDEEGAKQLAEDHGLDVDWDRLIREQIQEVIDRGDFALADSMCDEAGIDKLELDWH